MYAGYTRQALASSQLGVADEGLVHWKGMFHPGWRFKASGKVKANAEMGYYFTEKKLHQQNFLWSMTESTVHVSGAVPALYTITPSP